MNKKFTYLILIFVVFITNICNAQITVVNTNTANTLVAKLVGTGVSYSNPTLTCANSGAGYFVSTNAMLGVDSGIVLTTGYAKNSGTLNGINNPASIFASEDRGYNVGDADLFNLANNYNTSLVSTDINDACKLEFDFIPQGDSIRFKYKFGSEEYPNYVCSKYNDYFAFFISGNGFASTTNLALVPNTNIPVTINSINSGTVGSASGTALSYCTNMGPGSPFSSYYQNTSTSNTVVYSGTTILLEAKAAVTPCSTYHMKFIVADILDHDFDSGVFLKSGSFKSDGILFDSVHSPTALPIGWPYSTEGCNSDTLYVRRVAPKPFPQIVYITLGGTATNGVDYVTIPATVTIPANDTMAKIVVTPIFDGLVEATETLTIGLSSTNCNTLFSDTLTLLINEFPAFTVTDNDTICIGQTKTLSTTLAFANTDITFKWMPINIIANSVNITPLSTSTYTVSGRYPGCANRDSIVKINVANYPIINAGIDTAICIGNNYTINAFGNTTAPYPISYAWSPASTLSSSTSLTTIATPLATTTYTITATNIAGCTKSDAIVISAQPSFIINNVTTPVNCANINASITVSNTASPTNLAYNLLPNNIGNTTGIFTNLTGNTIYTITATSSNYCNTSTIISLAGVTPVVITNFNKNNITCNGLINGVVNITSTGAGLITYLLQPNNTTNNNGVFNNLAVGSYTIVATDAQNCFTSTTFNVSEPTPIVINNINPSASICNGANNGFINCIASGGTGILQYQLLPNNIINSNGSFSNLVANTYTVIVFDANGCSVNSTAIISQNSAIVIDSISTTLAKCNPTASGTAAIYASGGSGNLLFSANNGAGNSAGNTFINLINNTYLLTITDAIGCTKTEFFIINSVLKPAFANTTIVNATCNASNNGIITTTIINGNTSINYAINPNITNTNNGVFTNAIAGNYIVSISDANGCTATTVALVTQPVPIVVNALSSTPTLCNNTPTGTIAINASGGTGLLTYLLINNNTSNITGNFTGLGASVYTINVTDGNSCSKQSTISINQPSSLAWNLVANTNVNCAGGANATINASATGGTNAITYSLNGVPNNPPYNNLVASNYTIVASDVNGCSISTVVIVTQPNPLQFANISTTALSCMPGNDASINATIIGGTLPYNVVINGINNNSTGLFQNLNANNYTIFVTDSKACTISTIINISNPISPNIISVTTTQTGCVPNNIGSAIANVSNAQPSFVYTINGNYQSSNTFTNLIANVYTLIVKDTLQCKDTINFTITTTPNPIINNTIITPAGCLPGCDGVINITATGGTGALVFGCNNATQSANVFASLCPNNYTITVVDNNGCTASTFTILPIRPSPNLTISASNNISCNGFNNGNISCNTSGGTPGYSYTINGNANSTNNFTNLLPANYTIIVSDFYGCKDTIIKNIIEPSNLQISNIVTTNPSCFGGNNGSIIYTSTGGTGIIQYSINNSALQANAVFNNLIGNASYTISCIDANNCSSTSIVFLAQPTILSFANINADSATCYNIGNGAIHAMANGGSGIINYSITPNASANTTGNFINLISNNYIITITDANNCTKSSSVIVAQPPILNITNIVATPVTCNGNSNGSITCNGIGGNAGYIYTMLNNNVANATGSFQNLAGGNYTIQIADASGCTRNSIVQILEPNVLIISNLFKTNVSCFGIANGSINITTFGGNGNNIYSILPAVSGNNTTGIFINLNVNNYIITAIDSKGCSISSVIAITQPPILNAIISNTIAATCSNNSNGSITSQASGGLPSYTFTILPNNITNTSGVFNNISGGNYTIQVMDANNCTKSTIAIVTAPLPITIDSIAKKDVICFGENTGSARIVASGGTGNITYNLLPINATNSTGNFSILYSGTYTITAEDVNNCTVSSIFTINQNPKITITQLDKINPFCSGGTQGKISMMVSGGLPPLQYSFNNSAFTNITTYSNLILGSYTLSIKDVAGCRIDTVIILNEPQPLVLLIDSIKNIACNSTKNGSIFSRAIYGNEKSGYTYILLPANQVNNTGRFIGLSEGIYTVIARDTLGCEGIKVITIIGGAKPFDIDFEITPISCVGYGKDGIILAKPIGGEPPYSYQWQTTIANNTATITNCSYGYYAISITDNIGCTVKDSILIPASPCCDVYLPNVFTPNSDRKNDEFLPITSSSITVLQFDIFDRFGNRVFGTLVKEKGWNGMYKNTPMDMDTYFYVFKYKCLFTNDVITKSGDVILAR